MQLIDNKLIGNIDCWDIVSTGRRLTVKNKSGLTTLRLRLEPPGRIAIEKLDMRYRHMHIIATEHAFAVGRYISTSFAVWMHACVRMKGNSPLGRAIEMMDPETLYCRAQDFYRTFNISGDVSSGGICSTLGAYCIPLGICIGGGAEEIHMQNLTVFQEMRPDEMRRMVYKDLHAQYKDAWGTQ